jgi:hypothetical protein
MYRSIIDRFCELAEDEEYRQGRSGNMDVVSMIQKVHFGTLTAGGNSPLSPEKPLSDPLSELSAKDNRVLFQHAIESAKSMLTSCDKVLLKKSQAIFGLSKLPKILPSLDIIGLANTCLLAADTVVAQRSFKDLAFAMWVWLESAFATQFRQLHLSWISQHERVIEHLRSIQSGNAE